jgi:DNA-binding MarR family transcriptional regulator
MSYRTAAYRHSAIPAVEQTNGNIMGGNRADQVNDIQRLFRDLSWLGRQHLTRRIERYGLTAPQYIVLLAIGRLGPNVTMREVTEELQLPASSMTSIADRLVRQRLVERGPLPFDRRAVAATITDEGRALVRAIEGEQRSDLGAMLEDVADTDLFRFREVLEHLLNGVERSMAGTANTPADRGVRAG